MTGYADAAYAASLAEFGTPRLLPASRGWLLVAPVEGTKRQDARGCYPLFACDDWSAVVHDLQTAGCDLVSVVLVTDPFGAYTPSDLGDCFPDLCLPYKQHFVVDLERPTIAEHHARNIRKARVEVEHCERPQQFADMWCSLYANLVERHQIRGIAAFSACALSQQLGVPGLVMFRALLDGLTTGMILWYVQGDVGYYHLAAYTDSGYQNGASFALFDHSIHYFRSRLRWLNLGAGAGVTHNGTDGLTRFKSGWASGTRTAYLCGTIFDRESYEDLVRQRGIEGEGFFPLYRKGETR